MKRKVLDKIISRLIIVLSLLFLYQCQEMIISPLKSGSNVNVYVKGNKLHVCKGDTVITSAPYARFALVGKKGNSIDTLFEGILDSKGEWDTVYNLELLGIPNVQVQGSLDLKYAVDSIFYLCCDTSFVLDFIYNCIDIDEINVNCDSLDKVINLNLTNKLGGAILLGTLDDDIEGNILQFSPSDTITVNVNEATALSGTFTARVSPSPASGGSIQLGPGKQPLTIEFFVNTDVLGPVSRTINLPITCIDKLNNIHTGTIKINLSAEITDNDCACPFSSGNKVSKVFYPFSDPIMLGSTSGTGVFKVLDTSEINLGEGCYMTIDNVVRYNSTVPATELDESGVQVFEWKLAPQTFPIDLRNGITSFSLAATFIPIQIGENVDTFEIKVSVHNALGELKDVCSYRVGFSGDCCDEYCPVMIIENSYEATLNPGDITLEKGDSLYFNNSEELTQQFIGFVNTTCEVLPDIDVNNLTYKLLIDKDSLPGMCNPLDIEIVKSGTDAAYFNSWFITPLNKLELYSGFTGEPIEMGISFNVPSIDEYLTGHPSPDYLCDLTIRAFTSSGLSCIQVIHVKATIQQFSAKLTKNQMIYTMLTFSQISDVKSTPAHNVFSIPGTLYNIPITKLDDLVVSNDFAGNEVPNPLYIGDASFYFDVDVPDDTTLTGQMPELYLMNTLGNRFSHVTKFPVAHYETSDLFEAGIEDLVKKVFNTNGFTQGVHNFTFNDNPGIMWNNYLSKGDFAGNRDGVKLNYGDVFIVWNPKSNKVSELPGIFGGYCEVAFIYISKIAHGTEMPNADHLGNVSFIVAYPLSIVKP